MIGIVALAATVGAPTSVEPIVVTGTPLPDARRESLRDVIVISPRDIRSAPSKRIEDVLKTVAGVDSFRRAGSRSAHPTAGGISMRALGGNAASRALVLLDGVPQQDPFGGWVNFTAIQPELLGRIVVTRGGGSVRWGAGALAGTVEMESLPAGGANVTALSLRAGSRSSFESSGVAKIGGPGAYLLAGATHERGQGFIPIVASDRGPADVRAPYRQSAFRLRGGALLAPSLELQAGLSLFSDKRSRGLRDSDNETLGSDESLRLVGRGSLPFEITAFAQQRRFESQFSAAGAGRLTSRLTLDQFRVPARGYGLRAEAAPIVGPWNLRVGADSRLSTGTTHELFSFVAGQPTRLRRAGGKSGTIGLFGEAARTVAVIDVEAAARIDGWRLWDGEVRETLLAGGVLRDEEPASRSGWRPSFRIGAAIPLSPNLKIRAGAYSGWRLPTLNELYRPFRVGADATAANSALKPERSLGAEASAKIELGPEIALTTTAFTARLDDAIANVALGNGPGPFPGVGFVAAGGTYFQRLNVDSIRSRGLEFDLTARRGAFDGRLSAAWTRARVRSSGVAKAIDSKPPAQTPAVTLAAIAGWTGRGDRRASIALRYIARQYEDDLGREPLRRALTVGATLSWPLLNHVAIDLAAENIFNSRVETGIGSDGSIERAEPRAFWIGLTLR